MGVFYSLGIEIYLFVCKNKLLCIFDLYIVDIFVDIMVKEGLIFYIECIFKEVVKENDGSLIIYFENGYS